MVQSYVNTIELLPYCLPVASGVPASSCAGPAIRLFFRVAAEHVANFGWAGGAVAAPPAPAAKARVPKSLAEVDNGQVRGLRGVPCLLRFVLICASHGFSGPLERSQHACLAGAGLWR